MTKLVLDDISTGYGSTTKLNSNFDAIEDAMDNTLSRDGSSPNSMLANLDMNSKRILNLPAATSNTEPVTYAQFLAAQGDLLYTGEIDASVVVFTPAGTGSVETNVQAELVVKPKTPQQFGAVGDGTTDDTAAMQAAIDACIAGGGVKLEVPVGTYKITSPLTIVTTDPGGFIIEGHAPSKTKFLFSGSGYCFDLGTGSNSNNADAWYVSLKNLGIYGSTTTPTGGVRLNGTYFCRIENCVIRDFTNASGKGLCITGTGNNPNYFAEVEKTYFRNVPEGIYIDGGTGIGGNSNSIHHCWFGVHSTYAINIDAGDTNVISECEFNGSITTAINITGDADNNKIIWNQFDGAAVKAVIGASAGNTIIFGNTGGGTITDNGLSTFVHDIVNNYMYSRAGLVLGGPSNPTNIVPLIVKAPSGISTDSFRVVDSSNTHMFKVTEPGAVDIRANLTSHGKATFKNDVSGNSVVAEVNTDTTPGAIGLQLTADSLQTADMAQLRNEAGTVLWRMSPVGAQTFTEQTAPSAPSANQVVIYAVDNGAGKTQLMARFATGAVQQLAIEP